MLDRQPHQVHFVERQPQRADRALQHRSVGQVEAESGFAQQLAGLARFRFALGGQVDVGPAGEAVVEVPGGFAVAHENNFVHGETC